MRLKSLSILKAGTVAQPVLQKKGDDLRIDWGYMYVAVPNSINVLQYVTAPGQSVPSFADGKIVSTNKPGTQLDLNTVMNFASVGPTAKEKFIELGYDDLYSVQYFNQNLKPWWKLGGATIESELAVAATQYASGNAKMRKL